MKQARNSDSRDPYDCKKPWSDDCFVQCGGSGFVFKAGSMHEVLENPVETMKTMITGEPKESFYRTAFFEAFPNNPDTFIRGEGKSIEEAEESAWKKLQCYLKCQGHEFERRSYTNGSGFCKHCNMFSSKAFEPSTECCRCNKPTCFSVDNHGNYYCDDCYKFCPEENKTKLQKMADQAIKISL